jgi:pimeloyl-ACP methyl ester carboxylesterase
MTDLILLHGGQHGSWCWSALIKALKQKGHSFERIITLDMPGCGTKRGRPVTELTLSLIVEELNAELRQLDVRDGLLLGHSIAGVLLPMMAVEDPALFGHLIYLATAVPEEGQSIMQMLGNSRHGEQEGEVGWPLDPLITSPEQMAVAMFGADLNPIQLAWLLGEVAQETTPPAVAIQPVYRPGYPGLIPSTFILTLRDDILPATWQRRFSQRLHVDNVVEIDSPHEAFLTHPGELAAVIAEVYREGDSQQGFIPY